MGQPPGSDDGRLTTKERFKGDYMTNKELNAAIKEELKEAGYNTKDFSVSVKECGYSTSISVKIKSPEVNRKEIETLLQHREEYERDAHTYEILEGGNTYLLIDYAPGVFDEVAQEWAATANGVFQSKDEITQIFNGLYLIEHRGRLEILQQDQKEHCRRVCDDFKSLCIFIYKFAKFGTIAV